MTMLQLREYQQRSLDALSQYLKATCTHGAKMAFIAFTDLPYHEVRGLEGLPYVCLRVPTGGGKTLMAAYALGITATDLLQADRAVCLWLVPSNVIRDQTLAALKNRTHPYRQALDTHFGGNVRAMKLQEALYLQRGTLDGETVIVVCTLAALRVEDTDGRKVYETNGALQHHFTGLDPALRDKLETGEAGETIYSLANVLRLRRPVVIMDEAHNARTTLSFEMLARFAPSCIIEFTATPLTEHNPAAGSFASNILYHVSARELKEAEMIKLPIKLQTRDDWQEVIGDALQQQRDLEKIADEERRATGEYIRPIVLFQAQSKGPDERRLTVDVLKQTLVEHFRIPPEQVAIATGDTREIDGVDLFDPDCPLRYLITVQALREGWDCSFAYILCSVADQHSARAVEQILGRVIRMPRAFRKEHEELNCAYAFAASRDFVATANSLRDALIENGFKQMEVGDMVTPRTGLMPLADEGMFAECSEVVTESPDLSLLSASFRKRVAYEPTASTLTVYGVVPEPEFVQLRECFTEQVNKEAVERLYHRSHGRMMPPPVHIHAPFAVPALAVPVDGILEPFDETHFLTEVWDLTGCDPSLSADDFPLDVVDGTSGEIDVGQDGRLEMSAISELHQQLSLVSPEPGWTIPSVVNWLDHQIPHRDITQTQSSLFIHKVVTELMETRGLSIEQLGRVKFRLRNAVAALVDRRRAAYRTSAFQRALFSSEALEVHVSPECCFTYEDARYAPNWYYPGNWPLQNHYFPVVGELKGDGEEFECALFVSGMPQVKHWVRNLERRPEASFWLQTSTDKFYPDFVAELKDGRYLVVESKGEDRWSNDDSKEKRAVGELWAERSGGGCIFVMPKGKDFSAIRRAIGQ
jgi:type III restriction enzyme